ncbi:MAG: universal stress protein [Euryarchaeota archaeon]|nr:universal stress protein [Euryarchaeota archaeon]
MLPRRILVGYDGSDEANKALDMAVGIAKAGNAALVVQHVITVAPEAIETGVLEWEAIEHAAASVLDGAIARVRAAGVEAERVLSRGDAARFIVREAEARGADLIVVGSLGRGRMARLLVGSVADKLVRTATVPVLVVR